VKLPSKRRLRDRSTRFKSSNFHHTEKWLLLNLKVLTMMKIKTKYYILYFKPTITHSFETQEMKQNDKSKIQAMDMTTGKIKRESEIKQSKSNKEFTDFLLAASSLHLHQRYFQNMKNIRSPS
jgi:hypothetical protein